MTDAPTLTIRDLSVHYGRVQAVRRASLEVHSGEIVALLGANGAGKSSLLRAVAGLVRASEGQAAWGDLPLTGLPAHRLARAAWRWCPRGAACSRP